MEFKPFKYSRGDKLFLKPDYPFLLVYTNEDEQLSNAWLETEDELKRVIDEVKSYGCTIHDAIEIGSYRKINHDEI